MRQRPREINIFNMSLIDILCGALGAFCFMMLVLLPYYKPPGEEVDLQKTQKELSETLAELEKLRERMKDTTSAEELRKIAERLQSQVQDLQGQVNRLANENQQLRSDQQRLTQQNQQLSTENKRLDEEARSLRARRPFMVTIQSMGEMQPLDVYVYDAVSETKGAKNPPFDPALPRQRLFWPGDMNSYTENGVTSWVVRDAPLGTKFKIYVKRAGAEPVPRPFAISGLIVNPGQDGITLRNLQLTPERPWNIYGTLTVQPDGKLNYTEATPQERDAEWTEIMKGKTLPTPAPGPRRAGDMSLEERKALLERMQKEREARRASPPPGTATPAPQ